jgi:hypothetical protein
MHGLWSETETGGIYGIMGEKEEKHQQVLAGGELSDRIMDTGSKDASPNPGPQRSHCTTELGRNLCLPFWWVLL